MPETWRFCPGDGNLNCVPTTEPDEGIGHCLPRITQRWMKALNKTKKLHGGSTKRSAFRKSDEWGLEVSAYTVYTVHILGRAADCFRLFPCMSPCQNTCNPTLAHPPPPAEYTRGCTTLVLYTAQPSPTFLFVLRSCLVDLSCLSYKYLLVDKPITV